MTLLADGMPAQQAGLQPNDIVTHVDKMPIYDTDGLMLEIGKMPAEALVRLTVIKRKMKDGCRSKSTLAKYHVSGKKVVTVPPPPWRGLRVDYPLCKCSSSTNEVIDSIRRDAYRSPRSKTEAPPGRRG